MCVHVRNTAECETCDVPSSCAIKSNIKSQYVSVKSEEPEPSTSKTLSITPNIELTPRKKKMKLKIEYQSKKIKRLQSKTRYLKKEVASLKEILKKINEKALIDKEQKLILQNIGVANEELLRRQVSNKVKGKISRKPFSPEFRCFALTLNYYSPKAYNYIRKFFSTALPHPRTLTKWYATVDGRPGFTQEALNALKRVKDSKPDKKIYCSLVIDEMKIKDSPEWHPKSQRYYGYIDYGFDDVNETSEKATDALVFLLVGINTTWKLPLGYFLVKGTSGALKARLVSKAFELVHNTGVEIKALTCDGTKANIAMAEELGCCMDANNLQTTILDPTTGQQVHFFLDPCHMLKLIRSAFEHFKYFIDASGKKIEWNYILKLHQLQEEELFFLANKLKSNHIYFKTKIMNVRLAAQLFSESVADALSFCKNNLNLPDFANVNRTVEFLKIINDIFDILDSKTHGFGFKRAMNQTNYQSCFKKLDEAKHILMNLSADVPILY
ncbi:hypothetical protein evm_014704 [Chilo suppressalis]|nr:hypothetical protein evm_014704 [Chilo suppressalis]